MVPRAVHNRPRRWPYVVGPLAFVAGAASGPVAFVLSVRNPEPDAGLASGLALMWTGLWGLPWSVVPFNIDALNGQRLWTSAIAFAACAGLNVVLVTWLARRQYRRLRAPATS
jgi:hypothetical protein